jgi:hypothetical protein
MEPLEIMNCKKCGSAASAWGSCMGYVYVECSSCGEHTVDFYYGRNGKNEQDACADAVQKWNEDNG